MMDWGLERGGLRWKFNLALLPAVAVTVILLAWMDTAHERQAELAAHGQHDSAAGAGLAAGMLDPTARPEAVVRGSVLIHAVYAVLLLSFIAFALNAALSRFVLKPMTFIRDDIEKLERGHWRLPAHLAGPDEVGGVVERVHVLGLTIDALVAHMLRAERLATLASLAARTTARIDPCTERIGAAVSRLCEQPDGVSREAAAEIASANAGIIVAVRDLDRMFESAFSSASVRPAGSLGAMRPAAKPATRRCRRG